MKSKQEVIQQHYIDLLNADKFFKLKPHIDEDGWCLMFDEKGEKVSLTFKELGFEKDPLGKTVAGGLTQKGHKWRPKSLEGFESNNGWLDYAEQRDMINRKDYHLGFKHPVTGTYRYLGVYRHDNGFKEKDGHFVRPYPTHIIPIEEPAAPLY